MLYIILDTNLFVKSWLFDSFEGKALLDFLKRTRSMVVMPMIVWDEVVGQYREKLKSAVQTLNADVENVEKFLPNSLGIEVPRFDFDQEVEKYLFFLINTFDLGKPYPEFEGRFLPYPENKLGELAKRGIARKKPFSNKGEEFRDAILWLSVLEFSRRNHGGSVAFISENVKEFTDLKDKDNLHPDLAEEAKDVLSTNKLKYYSSLKKFIEEHHQPVQGINSDWVDAHINYELLYGELLDIIPKHKNQVNAAFNKNDMSIKIDLEDDIIVKSIGVGFDEKAVGFISVYPYLDKTVGVYVTMMPLFFYFFDYGDYVVRGTMKAFAGVEFTYTGQDNMLEFVKIDSMMVVQTGTELLPRL